MTCGVDAENFAIDPLVADAQAWAIEPFRRLSIPSGLDDKPHKNT